MPSDGRGLVSQAGAVLLWETMRATGLARGLSERLSRWRAPRAVHDSGKIVADLAAAVADLDATIMIFHSELPSLQQAKNPFTAIDDWSPNTWQLFDIDIIVAMSRYDTSVRLDSSNPLADKRPRCPGIVKDIMNGAI